MNNSLAKTNKKKKRKSQRNCFSLCVTLIDFKEKDDKR